MPLDRIVIHIGLPKCASTALQNWFYDNRNHLAKANICYPPPSQETRAPKHQALVGDLLEGHCTSLGKYIKGCGLPTLFLSSEGLSNHLFDYEGAALADFRRHAGDCPVDLIIVNRDPAAWVGSQWAQALVNGVMPQYHYGTALHLEEFARQPRNQFLMDHAAVISRAKQAYGARDLLVTDPARAQADIAGFLGFETAGLTPMQRHHVSPSPEVLELIRQINAIGLTAPDRAVALGALEYLRPSQHNQLSSTRRAFLYGDAVRVVALILPHLRPRSREQTLILQELRAHIQKRHL